MASGRGQHRRWRRAAGGLRARGWGGRGKRDWSPSGERARAPCASSSARARRRSTRGVAW